MKALIDTFSSDCQFAVDSPIKDYEGAVMVQTALRVGADCIVIRNIKDYKHSSITVLSPEEFLRLSFHQL